MTDNPTTDVRPSVPHISPSTNGKHPVAPDLPAEVLGALSRGQSVIPMGPDKKPLVKWKEYQTRQTTREELEGWKRQFGAKIHGWAGVTGRMAKVIVLDDDKCGWMKKLGLRPHVRSGSGGEHWYGEHPGWYVKTVNSKSSKKHGEQYPGLDIRGDGGYALIAGFNQKGGYTWLRDPEPDSLELLPVEVRQLFGLLEPPRVEARLLIDRALTEASLSGRNNGGFWLACQLRDNKFSQTEALQHGRDYVRQVPSANMKGDPEPYTTEDYEASVAQAYGASARDPWSQRGASGSELEPEEPLAEELEAALKVVEELADRARADVTTLAEPAILDALAFLKVHSLGDWLRVWDSLKQARLPLSDVARAVRDREKRWRQRQQAATADRFGETPGQDRTAGATLSDAPIADLIIPPPYLLREQATGKVVANEQGEPEVHCFAGAPVLITGKLRDVDEGTESLRLAWQRPLGWREMTVDRGVALDGRRVVALASSDFPVSSSTARDMVSYLDSLETANYARLPCARVSSHLGWQGKSGDQGFLWGRNIILPSGETRSVILDDLTPDQWETELIAFRGLALGDEQIAAGFHSAGTFEAWLSAVAVLAGYPRALLPFYASFVPPLLRILRVSNFIVDLANRTSTGKTTTLRAAASPWGNPDERTADPVLWTWDVTRVFVERACAVISGMPIILDDTKRARNPELVAAIIYALTSGQGRGRANTTSLSRTRTWQTVLLSSGEAPATSFTQDGGTRTRVLEIRGTPFLKDDQETRRVVDRLNVGVATNYGHAGPAFVRWLQENRARWGEFQALYAKGVESYANTASTAEAGRLAQYAAAISTAGLLVHKALPLPWSYLNPFKTLWASIAAEAAEASGELRALRDVISWAYSHKESFHGRHVETQFATRVPGEGWSGRWDNEEGWEFIAFLPDVLDKLLRERGYSPDAILSGWHERGWLDAEKGRRDRKVGFDRVKPRCVVVKRSAVEEIEGDDESE